MGNRSFVIFPDAKVKVYLHWNGGIESVSAFLAYANEVGIAGDDYGAARFAQIVGNFFGGSMSIGLSGWRPGEIPSGEDNGDFYVKRVDRELQIVRWVMKSGKDASPEELAKSLLWAAGHAYNVKGELLAELREKNDRFFKPEPASAVS